MQTEKKNSFAYTESLLILKILYKYYIYFHRHELFRRYREHASTVFVNWMLCCLSVVKCAHRLFYWTTSQTNICVQYINIQCVKRQERSESSVQLKKETAFTWFINITAAYVTQRGTHAQCEMKANSNISIPVSNYYHNLGVRTVFMGLQAKELYLEAKIRHTESAWNGAFSKKRREKWNIARVWLFGSGSKIVLRLCALASCWHWLCQITSQTTHWQKCKRKESRDQVRTRDRR